MQELRTAVSIGAIYLALLLVTCLASCPCMEQSSLPHGGLTGQLIRAFLDTYRELGSGFSEKVCRNALAVVLADDGLRVAVEVPMRVQFRGRTIGRFYADLIVNETVLVEVKAGATIDGYAEAQLLNYLKAAGGGVGLLVNFGKHPQYKRRVMGDPLNSLPNLHLPSDQSPAP